MGNIITWLLGPSSKKPRNTTPKHSPWDEIKDVTVSAPGAAPSVLSASSAPVAETIQAEPLTPAVPVKATKPVEIAECNTEPYPLSVVVVDRANTILDEAVIKLSAFAKIDDVANYVASRRRYVVSLRAAFLGLPTPSTESDSGNVAAAGRGGSVEKPNTIREVRPQTTKRV